MTILEFIKRMARPFQIKFKDSDPIYEGPMAHEYTDPRALSYIEQRYREIHAPNPATNPGLYNPLTPPEGWAWDPYYECWIRTAMPK